MSLDATSGKLLVDGAQVALKQTKSNPSNDSLVEQEALLSKMFFDTIMCCDTSAGPLSVRSLAAMESPADIPRTLQRVSGYTTTLRRCCTWLQCFNKDGWVWRTEARQGLVVITSPATWTRSYRLEIPLKVLVTGEGGIGWSWVGS